MNKQEEIREGIKTELHTMHFKGDELALDYEELITRIINRLQSQGVVIKVKCPDCEWSQFVNEESAGMTPCHSCNSTGYLVEPLIREEK